MYWRSRNQYDTNGLGASEVFSLKVFSLVPRKEQHDKSRRADYDLFFFARAPIVSVRLKRPKGFIISILPTYYMLYTATQHISPAQVSSQPGHVLLRGCVGRHLQRQRVQRRVSVCVRRCQNKTINKMNDATHCMHTQCTTYRVVATSTSV